MKLVIYLQTVYNGGLWGELIFYVVFFCIVLMSVIIFLIEFFRHTGKGKNKIVFAFVIGLGLGFFLFRGVSIVYNLLFNYQYVTGKTIGYCYLRGKKIEFEYNVNGKRYTNCNSHNPIEDIKVPGGEYYVRVSEQHPEIGRIDFEQPVLSTKE